MQRYDKLEMIWAPKILISNLDTLLNGDNGKNTEINNSAMAIVFDYIIAEQYIFERSRKWGFSSAYLCYGI